MDKEYSDYVSKLKEASNKIDMKYSAKRRRGGKGNIVDRLVFFKSSFQQATQWIQFPYQFVYWTALTPIAIANTNEFLKFVGFPLYIPLSWGSVIAIGLIGSLFVLGILSYTHLGMVKSGQELGGLQNSPDFLLFREIRDLKKEVEELRREVKE